MDQHPRIQMIANYLNAEVIYTWSRKPHIIQGVRVPSTVIIAPVGNPSGEFDTHVDNVKLKTYPVDGC